MIEQNSSLWSNFFEVDAGGIFLNKEAISTIGSRGYYFDMNSEANHLRAYNECAPLKAIVGKRAKAFNNASLSIIDTKTDKLATGEYIESITAKINKPNPLQTRRQFFAQHNTYLDTFGYCPVFITRPVGFPDDITNIWNIPPWLFDIEYTNQWLNQTKVEGIYKAFKMDWASGTVTLDPENLTIIFDDTFGTDYDINLTIPDSRLKGLDYPISNIVASYKARNTLITKRGAIGILSNNSKDQVGHIPLQPNEKEGLQKEFSRYGITGQDWQVIISDANLSWQQMGFPTKDLMLFEEIQDDIMRICDSFGYPYRLLSSEKAASYNDVKEFGVQFYQETVIPEAESRWEQFSSAIFKDKTYKFVSDFSKVPVLQSDKQAEAVTRKTKSEALERDFKNNVITLDMYRIGVGEEEVKGAFGAKYYYELLTLGWTFGTTSVQVATGQQSV